ncbi:MAG: hypothetical protein Q9183_000426 [Haloplaca sp. 2 TL-2023]
MANYPSRPAADTGPRSQHSLPDPSYAEASYGPSLKHYLNVGSHFGHNLEQQPTSYNQFVNTSRFDSNSNSGIIYPNSELERSSFGFKHPQNSVSDRHPLHFESPRPGPDPSLSARRASPILSFPSATQNPATDPLSAQLESKSVESQGDRQRSSWHVEEGNSDLEDGELSEGTDHNPVKSHLTSVSQMAHASSLGVNNKKMDSARSNVQMQPLHGDLRSDLPASSAATARYGNPGGKQSELPSSSREEMSARAKIPSPSRSKQGLSRPRQSQLKQSAKDLRDGAIHALRQLHAHKIDYPQMAGENMDVSVLKDLYTYLNTQLLKTPAASGVAITAEPHRKALPKMAGSAPVASGKMPEPSQDAQSLSNPGMKLVAPQSDTREPDTVRTRLSNQSLPTANQPQRQSNSGSGVSMVPGKIRPAAETHPLPSKIDNNEPPAKTASVQMPSITAPATDDKPNPAQQVVDKTQPSTASTTSHKNAMSKPATKPVDRKDYIARLQAAKAGKSLQAANSSQASRNTIPPKPSSTAPSAPAQKTELPHPIPDASRSEVPPTTAALATSLPPKTMTGLSVAAEAKRREQTELARRKIEELKKRSKEPKETQVPPAQVSTLPSTQESSSMQKSYTEAPSNPTPPTFPESNSPHNISQHSYFPLHSGTFAIPGLFMSGSRSEAGGVSNKVSPTKVHDVSRDMHDLDHMISEASIASASAEKPAPTKPDAAPESTGAGIASASAVKPAPTVPDAALESTEPPAAGDEDLSKKPMDDTEPSKPVNNPRKRPTAADFIEPVPVKIRRSHSGQTSRSVIIEVSDDDSEESDDEKNQMKSNSQRRSISAQEQDVDKSRWESSEHPTTRPQSAWGGSNGISDRSNGVPAQAGMQKKGSDEYRTKREEIEAMQRKIAEMEKRQKAKQAAMLATAQGSLGRPLPPSNTGEIQDIGQSSPDAVKQVDVGPSPLPQEERIVDGAQIDPTTLSEVSSALPPVMAGEESGHLQFSSSAAETTPDGREAQGREQQGPEQGNGIVAKPTLAEDDVEAIMSRLQTMQKEEADLQTLMQKKAEAKRALEKELEQLRQLSSLAARKSEQVNRESTEPQAPQDGGLIDPDELPKATQDHRQAEISTPVVQAPDISHQDDPITHQEATPRQPTPQPAPATEVPIDQSLTDGELAEDVMDISASEDEGIVTEAAGVDHADAALLHSESSDEEPYEPPVVFPDLEDSPIIPIEVDQPDIGGVNGSQSSDEGSSQIPFRTPAHPSDSTQAAMNAEPMETHSTSQAKSLDDVNDSDDYEPPEPATPVDVAPVTPDAAALASDSALPPVTTNKAAEARRRGSDPGLTGNEQSATNGAGETRLDAAKDHNTNAGTSYARFTPYESPLQSFHAYRYHPDFSSQIGSGYRSLTYSNAIDVQKPICPYEIGGRCNDASCDNQHFRSMSLSGAFHEHDA